MTLRLAFMGTPDFAVPVLSEAAAAGHDVAAVYTQPPRPAGRGKTLRQSPVHDLAEALGLPVRTPASMRDDDAVADFAALDLDVAVVVAYGQILPQAVLDAPRLGCVNLHASLLPRWRGAAPIQRAIMAGDAITGVQLMAMEAGLDTGPILLSETTPIRDDDTAQTLHDRLSHVAAQMIPRGLAALERGSLTPVAQSEDGVTYAKKIDKAEARLDWAEPAEAVDRRIRALSPFPGAWFELDEGAERVRVKALLSRVEASGEGAASGTVLDDRLLIQTGAGAVRLVRLQREGKGPQDADAFLRGRPVAKGTLLP